MCVLLPVCMCAHHQQLAGSFALVKSGLTGAAERKVIQPLLWIITLRQEDILP